MMPVSMEDWEILAKRRLPSDVYDFIAGGAGHEFGMSENMSALHRIKIISRVLRGVEAIDTTCDRLKWLTKNKSPVAPFLIAPTAHHQLAHPDGERATLAAAEHCGIPYILSTMSDTPMESLATGSANSVLFQLYIYKDRELTKSLIRRAEQSGCSAIVLTVDVTRMGNRLRDRRNAFSRERYAGTLSVSLVEALMTTGESQVANFVAAHLEAAISWTDIAWIREITSLPLILKGILHPADAELAQESGVDALYLSNHGGRQLDHHVSAVTMLPKIRNVTKGKLPLIVDGGVRSGVDAF
jgi:4-hydroxymandelate oxidase